MEVWSMGESKATRCVGGSVVGRINREEDYNFKWDGQERVGIAGGNYATLWMKSIPGVISFNPLTNPHHIPGNQYC